MALTTVPCETLLSAIDEKGQAWERRRRPRYLAKVFALNKLYVGDRMQVTQLGAYLRIGTLWIPSDSSVGEQPWRARRLDLASL